MAKTPNIVELDVRPQLREKLEPFKIIMDTVKKLDKEDVFVLHATFIPTPLLGAMKMKGFVNKVEKKEKNHWIVTFVNRKYRHQLDTEESAKEQEPLTSDTASTDQTSAKTIELDNRGLEPPQPMMRTLAALDRSRPGDKVLIHNDRVPVFLIEELNQLGCHFSIEEQSDGSAKVKIQKV